MFSFFLDDDGIFSKSREQHWNTLRALFAILATSDLAFNQEKRVFAILATSDLAFSREKCVFAVSELDFLDHRISATGVAPLGAKVR
jgi:hypothetical protein